MAIDLSAGACCLAPVEAVRELLTSMTEPGGICEEPASTLSPSDIQTYKGFSASVANAMKGRLSKLGKPVLGSVDWLRRA
ncbi:hypothetical protein I7I53_01133 [Histoplasma capsulatum var. duboisii H88]|uniref:Uncharacterized protein n=1 Tax=Ajellomyces capsulatus (strain H88) TaxID=544711 RepID=A0A8A1LJY5_AJEC8|nr:hypothetical protein I7I53_01133 [Histoplasma capsulatum var. duboisii H88]